jgi:hypothetical protein
MSAFAGCGHAVYQAMCEKVELLVRHCLRLLWRPLSTLPSKAHIAERDRDVRCQRRTSQTAKPAQLSGDGI